MAIQKKLILAFLIFYSVTILYLLLFLYVPEVNQFIISSRKSLTIITVGAGFLIAIFISFIICFLGSASIGFPVPFPVVLFSLSNSIILKYLNRGFLFDQILGFPSFWGEIVVLSITGGLGSALGELTGYMVGYGTKRIAEGTDSTLLDNMDGFGRLILKNKRRIPVYVFIFGVSPLPDDLLFIPLGLIKYPLWKCILPGWLGKSITILFYCCWPILIALGFQLGGIMTTDASSIITEALILLITLTIMFFIMAFNWNKYIKNKISLKKEVSE